MGDRWKVDLHCCVVDFVVGCGRSVVNGVKGRNWCSFR